MILAARCSTVAAIRLASMESLEMNEVQTGASSALFGSWRHTGVSRGLGEFQGRRPVLVTATGEKVLALPVEGLDGRRLAEFTALCGPVVPQLILTERRALALGLDASTPTTLGFDDDERDYGIAARTLRMLNCTWIVLLTNNPAKLKAASTEPGRRMLDRLRRRPAGVLKQLLDVQRLRG